MSDPAAVQPAATVAAETVSGDALASSLLVDTAAVPAPPPAGEPAPAAPQPSQTDALGRTFDAKKFRTKSKTDPAPFLNTRGHYMPRGGRKPGRATATAPESAPRASYVPPLPEAPKPAEATPAGHAAAVPPAPAAPVISRTAIEQTAEAYLRTGYLAADKIMDGKGEWKPDDPAEHAALKEPLVEYLSVTGGKPLPPWARVLVAVGTYILKRIDRPNTAKTARYYWQQATGAKPAQPAAAPRPAPPAADFSPLTIEPLR